ncbi:MAG: S8 family peptidase, partial [Proteobacteria bacterium]|nr:S8 family peptidase [Pseudomonadota bacterium]
MPDHEDRNKRHFILDGVTEREPFSRPSTPFKKVRVPERDRRRHGTALLNQVELLAPHLRAACEAQEAAGLREGFGLQVEFESFPDIELAFESLARERQGIELLNVRHEEPRTLATLFVPDGKLRHFEKLIRDYLEEKTDRRGFLRDHKSLIDTINQIRAASLRALWTDDKELFPANDDESFWWEVWLPVRKDRTATVDTFRYLALAQGLRLSPEQLEFPERTVLLAYTSAGQLKRSMMTLNCIAELRRAKETADFFDSLHPEEQRAWLDDLMERARFAGSEQPVPYVCLLDTGVNNGHPLLASSLANQDLHTVDPAWGTNDNQGHGTAMAGLALAGNLADALDSNDLLEIEHRLESVKLLPHDGANDGDAHHHGWLTMEAVARPEITAPCRPRVFGMAVTATDNRDRGRPSAWSAAVDRIASDADGNGNTPRLVVTSAGNIDKPDAWADYPASNSTDGVHDPGQAWNALTVGAYTELTNITEADADGYQPIASAGGLSPFSTTSCTWQPQWPLKPDVVFEGGNAARDALGPACMHSLSLLTTFHIPNQRLFTTTNATSAATALAARMAAQLMAAYPELWPETIRAL